MTLSFRRTVATVAVTVASLAALAAAPASATPSAPAGLGPIRNISGSVDNTGGAITELAAADPAGNRLTNTTFTTVFSGGMTGTGIHSFIDSVRPDNSAVSTGMARFTGAVEGRTGTFQLQSQATTSTVGSITAYWCIIGSSATGQLAGITGCGTVKHVAGLHAEYTLTYRLPRH